MNPTDAVNFTDSLEAAQTAFGIASNLQDTPLGKQIVSVGMLYLLLCKTSGVRVMDTLVKIEHILNDTDPYHHRQVAALKQLIREEYMK